MAARTEEKRNLNWVLMEKTEEKKITWKTQEWMGE